MENHNNTNIRSYKIVIMMMTLVLLGGLFYIYKMSDRSKNTIVALRSQKAMLIDDLKSSELKLNEAISGNGILSKQLIDERGKLKVLIAELQSANVSEILNLKFQKKAQALQNRLVFLMKEAQIYKEKADSATTLLSISEKSNENLQGQNKQLQDNNKNLNDKIDEATGLNYYNLQLLAYKIKSSGKQVETDDASKSNLFKVSFMIAENKLSKPKNKKYYIQIIDSQNNVLGEKQTITFGNKVLIYSYISEIKYDKKTIKVESELPVQDLTEGLYSTNIFDGDEMVLSTNFELK
jgi:hypothetical protein